MCKPYLDQMYLTQMPRDCRSIDLEYKKQEGDWVWATEWFAAQ
jgi:hypothetical protein